VSAALKVTFDAIALDAARRAGNPARASGSTGQPQERQHGATECGRATDCPDEGFECSLEGSSPKAKTPMPVWNIEVAR